MNRRDVLRTAIAGVAALAFPISIVAAEPLAPIATEAIGPTHWLVTSTYRHVAHGWCQHIRTICEMISEDGLPLPRIKEFAIQRGPLNGEWLVECVEVRPVCKLEPANDQYKIEYQEIS